MQSGRHCPKVTSLLEDAFELLGSDALKFHSSGKDSRKGVASGSDELAGGVCGYAIVMTSAALAFTIVLC